VAVAALVLSIIALAVSTLLAVRQQRFQRRVFRDEARDRKEQLALQRHALEYDEEGWRKWGTRPPKPPEE
jgi:hypothetical protein